MATVIQLNEADFNNQNLPKLVFPYTGIKDGLLAAHHLYHSLNFTRDLSGNGSELVQNGDVLFTDQYIRMGNGRNGFISKAADLASEQGNEFTICVIARQAYDSSEYAFPLNSYSQDTGGTNIQIKTGGIRPQLHYYDGDTKETLFSSSISPTVSTTFEAAFITCSVEGAKAAWHQPKYDFKSTQTLNNNPSHQSNYGGQGSRWLIGFADSDTNIANDVCYVAIFNRALSDYEIEQQYLSMQLFAQELGINNI